MGSGVLTSLNCRIITNINKHKTMFKLSQIKPFTIQAVMSSFLCKLGFHKLKYINKYRITSKLKCTKCGKKYIEGIPGELWRCN